MNKLTLFVLCRTNILWQPEASKAQEDIFTMLRSHINTNFKSIKDAFLEFDYVSFS